ncbi:unnamed protein product [Moneuplotes crassus]|uniref:Uncharacterized protein n=1 Tax=Euplotes crassus TaxID=5936 RepID=A0AAD1XZD8_EUPCR|nr:unnamed protein product [Moneuplotes crassus]
MADIAMKTPCYSALRLALKEKEFSVINQRFLYFLIVFLVRSFISGRENQEQTIKYCIKMQRWQWLMPNL